MAAEVKKSHGVDCELIEGAGGVFRVEADGEVIYVKESTNRFPNIGEVSDLLS